MKVLDLFCGAGGVSAGWQRAGHDVTGVDINPQPNYPYRFMQADALTVDLSGYDVIVASPPCQYYSRISTTVFARMDKEYPNLIGPVRRRLQESGKPYVIENVEGARSYMVNPIMLCGLMFDLKVFRHRLFESNLKIESPFHPSHEGKRIGADGYCCVVGAGDAGKGRTPALYRRKTTWQRAMGIDWMTKSEMTQAIPPAYSEYIALQVAYCLAHNLWRHEQMPLF